jgi:hypothetical protein
MKKLIITVALTSWLIISVWTVIPAATTHEPPPRRVEPAVANSPGVNEHEAGFPFITELPAGYREWKLISVAREEGELDDIRALLGNEIAAKACREGKIPFPEGAIIARIAWTYLSSEENNKTFGRPQSFVAGAPKNGVQFMVKDSTKYAATGGWGYGQFDEGKAVGAEMLTSCFPCHEAVKDRDFIFTRYAP